MTKTPDLKPRAIAVLVALSSGPLTTAQLKLAIGPERKHAPNGLLRAMSEDPRPGLRLIAKRLHDDRWYLSDEGVAWLERHGVGAVPAARVRYIDEPSLGAKLHALAEQIRRDPDGVL